MEIELTKQDDEYSVPEFIEILDDVTDEPSFKNVGLAIKRMVQTLFLL